jgi:hypothetical protein
MVRSADVDAASPAPVWAICPIAGRPGHHCARAPTSRCRRGDVTDAVRSICPSAGTSITPQRRGAHTPRSGPLPLHQHSGAAGRAATRPRRALMASKPHHAPSAPPNGPIAIAHPRWQTVRGTRPRTRRTPTGPTQQPAAGAGRPAAGGRCAVTGDPDRGSPITAVRTRGGRCVMGGQLVTAACGCPLTERVWAPVVWRGQPWVWAPAMGDGCPRAAERDWPSAAMRG